MRLFSFLVVGIVLCGPSARSGNVIVVVMDGARYSETFGAESTYVPRIWTKLRPQGVIWTNFRNEGRTETNPGHSSIATGTWQDIPNDGSQRPTMPTLCEYFRKGAGVSASDAYVIVGKTKLNILTNSTHTEYGPSFGGTYVYGSGDAGVYNALRTVMDTQRPRLITVNFADVDAAGHGGNWSNYLRAIRTVDSLIYEIWQMIQVNPAYRDNTTLIVANDHGRHDDTHGGFQNHGDGCEGCRHILLFAIGRGISPGLTVHALRTQRDIAPTVGQLLNVPTPLANGSSLMDDVGGGTMGVSIAGVLPASFQLEQSYPNPFNPKAVVRYQLPAISEVKLAVYDMLGRELAVLVNEEKAPGLHEVTFDGSTLASGTYLYRLTAGSFTAVKRMTLVK